MFLPFLLFLVGAFVSCEEVEEATKYDNWKERNEAFIDSIKAETGEENYVADIDAAKNMKVGKLYAIEIPTTGTSVARQYVYCKKLTENPTGERPLFSGYHSTVNAYYYGTLITGDKFDGTFKGYGALDRDIPLDDLIEPTDFDSPATFTVSGVIPGWTWPLQYMRTGERWMLYIPWESAYGASGKDAIIGYSALTFDLILDSVE